MKVSVITVTWNSGATLRDTLESVLRQTYLDIEHIIVDGGSTDNTMELVREYEPRYHGRLRYVSEPDKGIYDAMNKGIRMATGDIIGILNSDDFYTSSDIVEILAGELKETMWMPCMATFTMWMARIWIKVSAIIRPLDFAAGKCYLDSCPPIHRSIAGKKRMNALGCSEHPIRWRLILRIYCG